MIPPFQPFFHEFYSALPIAVRRRVIHKITRYNEALYSGQGVQRERACVGQERDEGEKRRLISSGVAVSACLPVSPGYLHGQSGL